MSLRARIVCLTRRIAPIATASIATAFGALAIALSVSGNQGVAAEPTMVKAGAAGEFRVAKGFDVELVYDVSAAKQGSWVSMCVDPKGRIIASDQYGKLYRTTINGDDVSVEELTVNIGHAQGMLCAFDSLYININARRNELKGTDAQGPGVYRLTDTDNDDQYDKVEYIVPMTDKAGEHGPHALVLSPDGKRIFFCSGNQVDVPESATSGPVSRLWDEDHLLGRLPDARGHMAGRLAPGGWICSMDPDGSNVELVATGFRNEYDIAFNQHGELFAYDADMEWDIGTPWYRPTRVNHVVSGAEFGWRNGTGKWPAYYGDSVGAVVKIGPGSPTGIAFGTGAKFPAKYQNCLFISDWSYGVIYAVNMQPNGASYKGDFESFVAAAPMAVTDLVVHPDGNLYFAVGGRRTASSLYRVKYTGDASTSPEPMSDSADAQAARELRQRLEAFHTSAGTEAVDLAMEHIGHSDRAIRYAARIALEHQDASSWVEQALQLEEPLAVANVAMALARKGESSAAAPLLKKLNAVDLTAVRPAVALNVLRAQHLIWMRLGKPSDAQREAAIAQTSAAFPSNDGRLNRELASTLVYLKAPGVIPKIVEHMRSVPAQDDQIHYAFILREQSEGWDDASLKDYMQWFRDVQSARGGASFGGFLNNIRQASLDSLSKEQVNSLGELAKALPAPRDPLEDLTPRDVVKKWTVEELVTELASMDVKPDFDKGRRLTATAQCFKCHRMAGRGGIQGPDLTSAGGRFSDREMLVAIIDPNKSISDQYQATQFLTEDRVITGRVANLSGKTLRVVENMFDPGKFTNVDTDEIIEQRPAPSSMMPAGLLDTFKPEEVAQILAYLKSGGDPKHSTYTGKQ